jgi:transposase
MGQKELHRWHLMKMVEVGKITLKEASEKIGVSYRQGKRIRRAIRDRGMKGLVHGNRGRPSERRLGEELRQRVLALAKGKYGAFNDTHLSEFLAKEEGIVLSREMVRRLRRGAGMGPKRRRRAPRHRKRRERKAQEGLMVIWDGSPHAWFGPKHSPCCLMSAIDDATGKVLAARFFPFEGSAGYLWLLRRIITRYGVPSSIYQDRHGALHRNDSHWTLEEEFAGRQEPTQVGWALEALNIHPIFALSPQAKGRVEKLFGTLQDRLVPELALQAITTIEAANQYLDKAFLRAFNHRFSIKPQYMDKAWRLAPQHLDRIISFRYYASVANDNAVRLGTVTLDIPPGPYGRSYAKARVEVRQLLSGAWQIYYQDQLIAKHPPTPLKEPLRALPRKKGLARAILPSQWVYLASAPPMENQDTKVP